MSSESAVQVPAVSCISSDGFKRKAHKVSTKPKRAFFSFRRRFWGTNGNCGPSSLSFVVGFGYLIVLSALENAPVTWSHFLNQNILGIICMLL